MARARNVEGHHARSYSTIVLIVSRRPASCLELNVHWSEFVVQTSYYSYFNSIVFYSIRCRPQPVHSEPEGVYGNIGPLR
jgi:hypothetical protein